jgi:hypothetical protein
MSNTLISIIIVNYKTPQLTINCADSTLSLPDAPRKEIIIVDNASGDGSVKKIREHLGDKIKLIASKTNTGFSRGNNLGAQPAEGDILFFLNSDTIIKKDIFPSCLEIFQKNKTIGILSPLLKTKDGSRQDFAFGNFPTFGRLLFRRTKKDMEIPQNENIMETDWVSGCALMIRRSIFKEISGWDENYFLYYEDIDLCKRVKNKGYKIAVDPGSEITHLGGESFNKRKTQKNHYYNSQDHYFKKHHGFFSYLGVKTARSIIKPFV